MRRKIGLTLFLEIGQRLGPVKACKAAFVPFNPF